MMASSLLDFSFSLLWNAMLLLGLAQIVELVLSRDDGKGLSRPSLLIGLLVGGAGLILMRLGTALIPGVIFDSRSVLLSISGLFLGAWPTLMAMAMTSVYRWFLGGPAALTGVAVILLSGVIGLIWRSNVRRPLEDLNWPELYLLGLVVHGAMLALMLLMPWTMAREVLTTISLPVLLLFPLLTVALGLFFVDRLRHRRDQSALREQEQRYRNLFNTVQTLIVALDDQGRITMINRFGCELLGYREDELLGRNWFEHCLPQPEGMARVYPAFCRIMAGELQGLETYENFVRCRGGSLHLIAWHNAHLTDEEGHIVGALGSGEDITARKALQDALWESERSFRLLTEQVPAIIYRAALDESSNTLYISPKINELGYSQQAWLENPSAWFEALHPDDRSRVLDEIDAWRGTGNRLLLEYRLRHADGRWIDIQDIAMIVTDSVGHPLYLQGLMLDVTEQKHREQVLRVQADELRLRNEELERFNLAMVDRENVMIELKRQINALHGELGRRPPFELSTLDQRFGEP